MQPTNQKWNLKKIKLVIIAVIMVISALSHWLNKQAGNPVVIAEKINSSKKIVYSKHAKCRMDCRHIDSSEIEDVLMNGEVNSRKSDPGARPCPVSVKEKLTQDQQRVRVVYGICQDEVKIITVIDLSNDFECHCP